MRTAVFLGSARLGAYLTNSLEQITDSRARPEELRPGRYPRLAHAVFLRLADWAAAYGAASGRVATRCRRKSPRPLRSASGQKAATARRRPRLNGGSCFHSPACLER